MEHYHQWHTKTIGKRTVESLNRNQFDAKFFDHLADATTHICNQIKPGMKIAFGGSMTIRSMEIREKARALGAILIDHGNPELNDEEKLETMRQELTSDIFICSSNAITTEGTLINVDGYGNRVAAMIFGPRKVIVVAGINKVVKDEAAAFERIEQLAAPMNMKRLERETPCTHDGICHNCQSTARGCRAYTIIRKRPVHTPTEVLIIDEPLGM
ncbi:MAG: lactate utilization protein [Lentimicrobium sp.]|nr:lactate utilization protein [Lentimicrobium sp.]HPG32843.1 lactate utilization protein [Lentimicrobium sp.]